MVKPFYVDTTGAWVPGHNQTKSAGSQLQAGARADLIPSPVTKALSSFGGRIAAQTMQFMFRGNVQAVLNYTAFRPYAMMEAVKLALGDSKQGKIVLNPAGGYSPACYWLAQEMPEVQFIEMDVAKTIDFKKNVLEPFSIPDNLELRAVDLTQNNLHDVQQEKVDVIIVSGAYVSHKEYQDMLGYIKNILKKDACVIGSFPDKSGIENFLENSTVFTRIVANPRGAIDNEDGLSAIFKGTDFGVEAVVKLSELAKQQKKPIPADIEVIAIARQGIAEVSEVETAEFDILSEIDEQRASNSEDSVAPFVDFDLDSFKRFPKRYRRRPPESKI